MVVTLGDIKEEEKDSPKIHGNVLGEGCSEGLNIRTHCEKLLSSSLNPVSHFFCGRYLR